MVGPGDLIKSTTGQATVAAVNTANTTVNAGQLTADSISTGTLSIKAGAKVTISPIPSGPGGTPLAQKNLKSTCHCTRPGRGKAVYRFDYST